MSLNPPSLTYLQGTYLFSSLTFKMWRHNSWSMTFMNIQQHLFWGWCGWDLLLLTETLNDDSLGGNPRLSPVWVVKLQLRDCYLDNEESRHSVTHVVKPVQQPHLRRRRVRYRLLSRERLSQTTRVHTSVVLSGRESPNCGNPSARNWLFPTNNVIAEP